MWRVFGRVFSAVSNRIESAFSSLVPILSRDCCATTTSRGNEKRYTRTSRSSRETINVIPRARQINERDPTLVSRCTCSRVHTLDTRRDKAEESLLKRNGE